MFLSWETVKAIDDSNVTPHWLPQFCETNEPHVIPPIQLDAVLRSRHGIRSFPSHFFGGVRSHSLVLVLALNSVAPARIMSVRAVSHEYTRRGEGMVFIMGLNLLKDSKL